MPEAPTRAPEVLSVPEVTETAPGPVEPGRPDARGPVATALRHPLVWPVLALLVLLVIDVIANPSFLSIRMQDGHLYGNLIDILRNGSPVLLVALGMTLVIATRGIDLSVGAIAAISGAIACVYIVGSDQPGSASTAIIACSLALAASVALGLWNGFLVAGARHPADHRDPGADDCRPRPGDAGHRRADHHGQQRHLRRDRGGLRARPCRSPSWSRSGPSHSPRWSRAGPPSGC